jgi:hypothetical protein
MKRLHIAALFVVLILSPGRPGFTGPPTCATENGDINGDGATDLSDVVFSLAFSFQGGPAPVPFCVAPGTGENCAVENGDTNGDGARDVSDSVYSLLFSFHGGPEPVPICPVKPGPCDDMDGDTDSDGVCGLDDNCPEQANVDQADRDGDGMGDVCDSSPVDDRALVAYWPLDTNWSDEWAGHDLVPWRPDGGFSPAPFPRGGDNGSYGPTAELEDNGAVDPALTGVPADSGVTIAGWVFLTSNSTGGVLFGFGESEWNQPSLLVRVDWGFLAVRAYNTSARYARIGDNCWHHVALVAPPGFGDGEPLLFFLDGVETEPGTVERGIDGTMAIDVPSLEGTVFGRPFSIGQFERESADEMRVDEVRLFSRALQAEEVALLATATGEGDACANPPPPDWAPGPRCTFPEDPPTPQVELTIRVLSDDTIVVVTDLNPWLDTRLAEHCGVFLRAMEQNAAAILDWQFNFNYRFAVAETLVHYRPFVLAGLGQADHIRVGALDENPELPTQTWLWPQSVGEYKAPRQRPEGGRWHTDSSEVVYFSYLRLPFRMEPGRTYRVADSWGNSAEILYDDRTSISWALKVDQVGYLRQGGEKYAYLGAWLGPGGAMDLGRFAGEPFSLRSVEDNKEVFQGVVRLRTNDLEWRENPLTGETVYELDFSGFNQPGSYYVQVDGLGRSWPVQIGDHVLGEAHYVHTRGLYHQRCGVELSSELTPWNRPACHTETYQGGFPPDSDDYADHADEGWGFRDEQGNHVSYSSFGAVEITATDEVLDGVHGGWHDAADYDRRTFHFTIVRDLTATWLLFPDNFADGQLNIPESGNGVPDLLDEAAVGVEVWRRAQREDGGVGTWIEAVRHPAAVPPAEDELRYYLSLATRNSSLHYARHAALAGRALVQAGDEVRGQRFIDSAVAAYTFGTDDNVRVSVAFQAADETQHTWTEPPSPDPGRIVQAAVQLWLATSQTRYRDAMDDPDLAEAFALEVLHLHWRTEPYDVIDVALEPDRFPEGWGDAARARILEIAEDWVARQETLPYRKLWYDLDHGYFGLMGWGQNGFKPILNLVAAWRLSGEDRFRDKALLAVNWMHGGNPQGRVNTTGLGQNQIATLLHIHSLTDDIAEPVPGMTLFAYTGGIDYTARSRVWGLFYSGRDGFDFDSVSIAQLPPPWDDTELTEGQISEIVYATVPLWRRFNLMENANVPQTEFTVHATIGPAAATVGALMNPGWMPDEELLQRAPKDGAALSVGRLYQP